MIVFRPASAYLPRCLRYFATQLASYSLSTTRLWHSYCLALLLGILMRF
jgi:hypothetical protein